MSQFTFDLALPARYSTDNFVVSACNQLAHDWLARWPDWPMHAFYLYGPTGSGKSHLAHMWAERTHAQLYPADALPTELSSAVVIENIEHTPDEAALFHLFNRCKEEGKPLLLTAACSAAELPLKLPDLLSRLRACPAAAIEPPDDALLAAVLRKQFADRQLWVNDEIIDYVVSRMERSFTTAQTLVTTLDQAALQKQKTLTIPFVREFLQ
jgi:DnaA regulatory inactivator Hda